MNSALNASAIRRASVVLPTPGGPHRIIECSLPEANATASGLPGASRCRCPITSSMVRGRRRSASGTAGRARPRRRGRSWRGGVAAGVHYAYIGRPCQNERVDDPFLLRLRLALRVARVARARAQGAALRAPHDVVLRPATCASRRLPRDQPARARCRPLPTAASKLGRIGGDRRVPGRRVSAISGERLFPADVRARATACGGMIRDADEYVAHAMEGLVEQLLFTRRTSAGCRRRSTGARPIGSSPSSASSRARRWTDRSWRATPGAVDFTLVSAARAARCAWRPQAAADSRACARRSGRACTRWMNARRGAAVSSSATYPPHWKAA